MTVVTDEPITVGDLSPKVIEGMVNAGHEDFTGPYDVDTRSGRASAIQDAIDFAENQSPELPFVLVPDALGPGVSGYDASSVNFSGSGGTWTGRMVRAGQQSDVYDVKAYGAAVDGSADDTAAIQAAVDAAADDALVRLPVGTVLCSSTVNVPAGIDLVGHGFGRTTLDLRGDPGVRGTSPWKQQTFRGFTATHANASGTNVDIVDAEHGASFCRFIHIKWVGQDGVTQSGFRLRGADADGNTNGEQFNNVFHECQTASSGVQVTGGIGVWLDGNDAFNQRANLHRFIGGVWSGFNTAFKVEHGNLNQWVGGNVFSADTAAFHIVGNQQSFNNFIFGTAVDSTVSGDSVRLERVDGSAGPVMLLVFGAHNIEDPSKINVANGTPKFTIMGRQAYLGNVNFDDLTGEQQKLAAQGDSGLLRLVGGENDQAGGMLLSGTNFTRGVKAVGNSGSVSAVLQDVAAAVFRLVKTSNGSAFTGVLEIDRNGIVDYQGTMEDSSKDPATDAPDDWVEVEINGTTYFLPAYLA